MIIVQQEISVCACERTKGEEGGERGREREGGRERWREKERERASEKETLTIVSASTCFILVGEDQSEYGQ